MHIQNRFNFLKIVLFNDDDDILFNDDDDIEKLILKNSSLIFSAMIFVQKNSPKTCGTLYSQRRLHTI